VDYRIEKIEGIGPAYAKKLAVAGIHKTSQLLSQCAAAKGRKAVAVAVHGCETSRCEFMRPPGAARAAPL
jgi:hypothetical protein